MCMGSSPLTRGKLSAVADRLRAGGLIPAHAGKTTVTNLSQKMTTAHPRSRGENVGFGGVGLSGVGSSPLTRGKRTSGRADHVGAGLIPAHAGKTDGSGAGVVGVGAHPRSRGENAIRAETVAGLRGSSPLTRGKRSRGVAASRGPWLIPAHAGKTDSVPREHVDGEAHPRSRGENVGTNGALP